MGDRKVRVDRDRTLEQRYGRGGAARIVGARCGAVGLPALRATMSWHRRAASNASRRWRAIHRLASATGWPSRSVRPGRLLSCRLRLLVGENVAGRAVAARAAQARTDCRASRSIHRAPRRCRFGRRRPEPAAGVNRASAGCSISLSSCRIRSSETRLRNGDCRSCTASPCRSISSNTGSPVVLLKSARTMVSLSVSVTGVGGRSTRQPTAATTSTAAPTGTQRRPARTAPDRARRGSTRSGRSASRCSRCRSVRMSDACW